MPCFAMMKKEQHTYLHTLVSTHIREDDKSSLPLREISDIFITRLL